jgi:hypothetical protein
MFIIEYNTPADAISGDFPLDLDLGIPTVTIDRSQNGRILLTGISPTFSVGGQLDIAELAGRPNQPMLIEAFSIASDNPAGVTSISTVRGPLEPGNTDNSERVAGAVTIVTVDFPVIFDIPILIPAQHRWAMSVVDGPIRVILQCRELQAGDLENGWIQSHLIR